MTYLLDFMFKITCQSSLSFLSHLTCEAFKNSHFLNPTSPREEAL